MYVIIGSTVGASVLLLATIISYLFMRKGNRRYFEQGRILKQKHSLCLSEI